MPEDVGILAELTFPRVVVTNVRKRSWASQAMHTGVGGKGAAKPIGRRGIRISAAELGADAVEHGLLSLT